MKLHFFEDYIEDQYNQNKIETMFPDSKGNIKMCCPFKHVKKVFDENTWEEKEIEYLEKIPSSSINLEIRVFHCFTCDRTYKEIEFAQKVLHKTKEEVIKEYVSKDALKTASESWRDVQHKSLL